MARRLLLMLAMAGLVATAACASNEPTPRVDKPHGAFRTYVAIGDSSTAGPGIHPVDRSSGACSRAKKNYPALLAKALKIPSVRDVSCSGALTKDITEARPIVSEVPGAMLDAVTADTELVTVSIGGNDGGASSGIVVSCLFYEYDAAKCAKFLDTKLDKILKKTVKRLASALESIKTKAPNARVILIGYLPVMPEDGGCVMPDLDPARIAPTRSGLMAINQAFKKAADSADVDFISLVDRGADHISCDGDKAWVTGMEGEPGNGALLHPNKRGMRAVANILAAYLEK
ncbi:lysophospholipase L1-like esterase [Aeromicrobium panaciterrae]|uniref:Lysophospholipase L1-like esterase n=1 Tax=Aeromicrobium panaciterrae TaxID=363861 RepID=A0ABU1UQB3_9ACTN|nr:SGNH/GDSL hydrolase family protein [Aeromicrobium panaciterrae]MDR7087369.1 lysophospholipase L1-like esterase [Aeromicrobium panaciterrae]